MRVIYAKYSRGRLPQFQILTRVLRDEGGALTVEKRALTPAAQPHIDALPSRRALLGDIAQPVELTGGCARFSFASGVSRQQLMLGALQSGERETFLSHVTAHRRLIESLSHACPGAFSPAQGYLDVFGEDPHLSDIAVCAPSNLDMTFDNLLIGDNGVQTLIDYEWTFDFPVPAFFIAYRCALMFSVRFNTLYTSLFPDTPLHRLMGVEDDLLPLCAALERAFGAYVHGESYHYPDARYQKPVFDVRALLDTLPLDRLHEEPPPAREAPAPVSLLSRLFKRRGGTAP